MLQKSEGPLQLGTDPESGLPVYFKIGPFGYYLQRGENGKGKDKPKRVKLPEEFDPEDLRLETALKLLSLPRPLGKHPESGKSVRAGLGRFGPYVVHDGTYASLTNSVQLLEIELEEALKLLKTSGKKKTSRSSKTIKELGEHPADGTPVRVMNGRFGPFIRHGKLNASIPKNRDPEEIELEEAMELLEAKKKRKKKKKRTRKKAASAAKKSAGAKSSKKNKKKKPSSKS